jgi:hypothetical protein
MRLIVLVYNWVSETHCVFQLNQTRKMKGWDSVFIVKQSDRQTDWLTDWQAMGQRPSLCTDWNGVLRTLEKETKRYLTVDGCQVLYSAGGTQRLWNMSIRSWNWGSTPHPGQCWANCTGLLYTRKRTSKSQDKIVTDCVNDSQLSNKGSSPWSYWNYVPFH